MKNEAATTTNCGLPPRHFAILFEGAWIFSPGPTEEEITAFCPFPKDDGHHAVFGRWSPMPVPGRIVALPGLGLDLNVGSDFRVTVYGFDQPQRTFSEVFEEAATKYPFVYMPAPKFSAEGEQLTARFALTPEAAATKGRRIAVPIPARLLAAGEMTSAEIDGTGLEYIFGGPPVAKRLFTTFIFLYECPDDDAHAKVCTHAGDAVIEVTDDHPKPHLIFKVFPGKGSGMPGMVLMPHDASGDKVHATTVFETLRQAVALYPIGSDGMSHECCDIAVYHDRGATTFEAGDSGLTNAELGIRAPGVAHTHGLDSPACATGSIATN